MHIHRNDYVICKYRSFVLKTLFYLIVYFNIIKLYLLWGKVICFNTCIWCTIKWGLLLHHSPEIFISVWVCMCVHMYVHMCVSVCACTNTCVSDCVYVCGCVHVGNISNPFYLLYFETVVNHCLPTMLQNMLVSTNCMGTFNASFLLICPGYNY